MYLEKINLATKRGNKIYKKLSIFYFLLSKPKLTLFIFQKILFHLQSIYTFSY